MTKTFSSLPKNTAEPALVARTLLTSTSTTCLSIHSRPQVSVADRRLANAECPQSKEFQPSPVSALSACSAATWMYFSAQPRSSALSSWTASEQLALRAHYQRPSGAWNPLLRGFQPQQCFSDRSLLHPSRSPPSLPAPHPDFAGMQQSPMPHCYVVSHRSTEVACHVNNVPS